MKKTLLIAVSIALVCVLALGGTIAYLQDTDSDVNVMTMGNVSINQHEYERATDANGNYKTIKVDGVDSYELQHFTQGKPLLPFVGEVNNGYDSTEVRLGQLGHNSRGGMEVFPAKNVQDKFVVVENDGLTDAYVRTLVAFEAGSVSYEDLFEKYVNYSFHFTWGCEELKEIVNIDGNNYVVVEFVYCGYEDIKDQNGVLKAGDYTYNSLAQVYMYDTATNEDVKALDGNKNGKYDILVLSQAVQADGFVGATAALEAAFGNVSATNAKAWFEGEDVEVPTLVEAATVQELQEAVDNATGKTVIVVTDTIDGYVYVTQKPGVEITIEGNGNDILGAITVDGKSGTYTTAGLEIKNFNFNATSLLTDACIQLGDGTNATRYTCNVTVCGCTFDVPGAVGVKSYTGGDKNLTICDSTATAKAHSLVQAKGIDGIKIDNCKVYSKNGLNFNNSTNVVVDGCTVDVKGYAVRFGESSGGVGAAESYLIKNSTLKSANDDGDATIILRGTADNATLTLDNVTVVGTPDIQNTATGAKVVTK